MTTLFRTHIEAPISGLHSAKTPPTAFGEFLEQLADITCLLALFFGAFYGMPYALVLLERFFG